jgi:hypothetical protein
VRLAYVEFVRAYRGYTFEMIDDMPIERFLMYLPEMKAEGGKPVASLQEAFKLMLEEEGEV